MTVIEKKLSELVPYEKNPRHNKEAVKGVKITYSFDYKEE